MAALREFFEMAGAFTLAIFGAVLGAAILVIVCAAPFVAIGSGVAFSILAARWALGY